MTMANSADPDQMPQNVASDQGLYCLHFKNRKNTDLNVPSVHVSQCSDCLMQQQPVLAV